MNKNELISAAATRCGHPQKIVKECLDAILCIVSEELSKGGEVKVLEFGRLYSVLKKAQTVRIPSGKVIEVPAKNVVRFKAYSHFNHYSTKY
jgi:nucleoid DNA-binding protein